MESDRIRSRCQSIDRCVLVKPQFEVGKGEVGKGGIVRDPAKRLRALEAVSEFARQAGYVVAGSIPSPVAGAEGNQEFLLYLQLDKGAMIHAMNPKIRKIGIIFKKQDARVRGIAADIVPWLQSRGVEVFLDQACGGSVSRSVPVLLRRKSWSGRSRLYAFSAATALCCMRRGSSARRAFPYSASTWALSDFLPK